MLFYFYFFSLVNLTSALKALVLFLDYNVRMLCDFNTFLHIIYDYMVTFTLFVYLFNPNTKYRDIYRIPQISQKYRDMNFCSYRPALVCVSE